MNTRKNRMMHTQNINEYNLGKIQKVLIVFAYMISNNKGNQIATQLFISNINEVIRQL